MSEKLSCLVLTVIDCLRPDHLGCAGYRRQTSPFIDRLAERGILFQYCYPQGIYTFPSHVSLLTSIHHVSHSLENGALFDLEVETMTEYMREAGFETAAFVSNGIIAGQFGLDRGFDLYDDNFSVAHQGTFSRSAREVKESLERWLRERRPGKSFIFIHFNDCHGPYTVPAGHGEMFINDDIYRSVDKSLSIGHGPGAINPRWAIGDRREVNFYISQYDSSIRYVDDHLKIILDLLKDHYSSGKIMMIITGDHGEAMGERGIYFTHGKGFYEEFLKVPLIIKGHGLPEGKVVSQPVRHVDILPTLLECQGLEIRGKSQGRSLMPLINGHYRDWDVDLFDVYHNASGYIREGSWKYIVTNEHALMRRDYGFAEMKRRLKSYIKRPLEELYDLASDPREQNNKATVHPDLRRRLRKKLFDLVRRYRSVHFTKRPISRRAGEEEIKEHLRQLGYLDGD